MTELIKINEHNGRMLVNARELHYYLEVRTKYADWIKNRIEKYGFIENQDYVTFSKNLESGGRTIEYGLTLDMAKELCMVENNDKGRTARRYFIAKEKEANNNVIDFSDANAVLQLAQNWAEEQKKRAIAEKQVELQAKELKAAAPKVEYYEEVMQSESAIATNVIAKELGMSAISLNKKLHQMGVIYKSGGSWVLYHKFQDKGFHKTKTHHYTDSHGMPQTNIQMYWTEKGREFILSKLRS